MNAALFMLTSAWMAGADVAPAAPAPGAPAVVSTGSSCGTGCNTGCSDPCGGHSGLWSKLKGRFYKGGCGDSCAPACAPAPVVCCKPAKVHHCKPAPVCAPVCKPAPVVCCKPAPVATCSTGCSDPCGKPSFWSKIKGRFHKSGCGDTCDTCGAAPAPGGARPEVIPAPKDKKEMPKGGVTNIQIEPILTPVVAPRQPIEVGGPVNPF